MSSAKAKAASSVGQLQQPPAKKARKDTSEKNAPLILDYMSAWTDTVETDQQLSTANSLFESESAWFVRDQYIALYEQIVSRCDQDGQTWRSSMDRLVLESRHSSCTHWRVFD